MYYTDDPLADFARYDAEQQEALGKLPKCSECDEPIQDEYAYYINGEWVCECCMREHYRKEVQPL